MKASASSLFPLLIVGVLALATYWLQKVVDFDGVASKGVHRHDPDFIAKNMMLERYDKSGALRYRLNAQTMTHFPDDDSTELELPQLRYVRPDRPTRISARAAWVSADGVEVRLQGDVVVIREPRGERAEFRLTTERLTVFPDDELARTDAPVRFVEGNSHGFAEGMVADNLKGEFRFLKNVQATIERKKS